MKIFLLAGSGFASELESFFLVNDPDKFCLYMRKRCICVSLLDIVNEFLFKNVTKSIKGHLSASFIKDKKIQSSIKKSVSGYLCHSH